MLDLPEVTLIMIETLDHELARLAVKECTTKARFGEVLICTDKPDLFGDINCTPRFYEVPNWPDKISWSRFNWHGVPPLIKTRQTLGIQWDSWIWDTGMWQHDYLEYDYIGAPWWYTDGRNVGNGGFAMRSKKLLQYVYNHKARFPVVNALDDDLFCRKYRADLENVGFVWAPEKLARDFAFECVRPSAESRHFGFHGAFNFGAVLDRESLEERVKLMAASKYIANSYMMKNLKERHPELANADPADHVGVAA